MRCPHCNAPDDKVIESRTNSAGTAIRRRRECLTCGYRFTSYEHIEEKPLKVVKRDGRREAIDRQKLERGIQTSLEKRPIPQETIEQLINTIEDQASLESGDSREIGTFRIGEMVLEELFNLDKVGYIRFASVYRMFEDIETFKQELDILFSKDRKKAGSRNSRRDSKRRNA